MWKDIASILKDNKSTCIIIEDGEPRYVVVPFDEYQQLQKNSGHSIVGDMTERANHELQEVWEPKEEERELKLSQRDEKVAAISIEDLPF